MIAFLAGTVASKSAGHCLLEVGGIGYRLAMSTSSLAALPAVGDEVIVHTHLHVREDELSLFGFESDAEKLAFEQLITVSGVGPKVALATLSALSPDALSAAVASEDVATISGVPGIGKKTAQRIILDLKDKLGTGEFGPGTMHGGAGAGAGSRRGDGCAAGDGLLLGGGRGGSQGCRQLRRRADAAAACAGASRRRPMSTVWEAGQTPTDDADDAERLVSADFTEDDLEIDRSLRPKMLDEYLGQTRVKENLSVLIEAARGRNEPLDHVLLSGPPGLGKTTLAQVISNELGVKLKTTSGPAIERPGDLAAILTNLEERDVLFIDEIHRLNRVVEEVLYPAMEDFTLDIVIGKGPAARSIRLELPRFTLMGATTRTGLLTGPLRDRFGMAFRLDYYTPDELSAIVVRSAGILDVAVDAKGAAEIARRSRGTPRLANRLLKRVRDFAQVRHDGSIDENIAAEALAFFEVDHLGLDTMDNRILTTLASTFVGRPVGLNTLASAVGEEPDTLEDVYEPYLLQLGLLMRTPKGRQATARAYEHLGLTPPAGAPDQAGLF